MGIDPGSRGAICVIDTEEKTCRYMKLPFKENGVLNTALIRECFNMYEADYIYCEQIHGMKPWGVSNNFRFGGVFWMVQLFISKYPHQVVTPQAWQKKAHVGIKKTAGAGEAKKRSLIAFRRLNPDSLIKDPDVIDAYHIARFAGQDNNVAIPNDLFFIEVVE